MRSTFDPRAKDFNEDADFQHKNLVDKTNTRIINQQLVLFRVLIPIITQNFDYFFLPCGIPDPLLKAHMSTGKLMAHTLL